LSRTFKDADYFKTDAPTTDLFACAAFCVADAIPHHVPESKLPRTAFWEANVPVEALAWYLYSEKLDYSARAGF